MHIEWRLFIAWFDLPEGEEIMEVFRQTAPEVVNLTTIDNVTDCSAPSPAR